MKNVFLALVLWIITSIAYGDTSAIFQSGEAYLLKPVMKMKDSNFRLITNLATDPSAVAYDAVRGSLYVRSTTGVLYQKQDNGLSTNWVPLLIGPASSGTDECLARWNGTGVNALQDSIVCITDLGAITGPISLDVGELFLSGSTIQSTSGALILSPQVNIPALTASLPLKLDASKNIISQAINLASSDVSASLPIANGGTNSGTALNNDRIMQSSGGAIIEAPAITADRVLISDVNGIPTQSTVTSASLVTTVDSVSNATHLNIPSTIMKRFTDGSFASGRHDIGDSSPLILTNPLLVMTGNFDDYLQASVQNTNNGQFASSDYVATADNGSDTANYIDMGINNSGWADPSWTINGANDGYVVMDGGDLALGTQTAHDIIFFNGGSDSSDETGRISTTNFSIPMTTSSTDPTTGSITTMGGLGVAENINSGGKVAGVDLQATSMSASGVVLNTPSGDLISVPLLPLDMGGTGSALSASAGAIAYSDADSLELSAIGTTGNFLLSGGVTAPTWWSPTNKAIPFGQGGTLAEDAELQYDSTLDLLTVESVSLSGTLNLTALTASTGLRLDASKNVISGNDQLQVQNLGDADSPIEKIYTPKNQITSVGTNQTLLEMGNDNILANPDFEASVVGQSWTSVTGALTLQTSGPVKGLSCLRIALVGQSLDFYQSASTPATLVGNQAEASTWARSTTSTSSGVVLFGPRIDGTNSSTSIPVVLTSNWQLLKIPFVTGSLTQGLFLKSTVGMTNDIEVDNAKVIIGEVKNTSSVVSAEVDYSTYFSANSQGFGGFSSPNFKYRFVGNFIEVQGTGVSISVGGAEARLPLPAGFTIASNFGTNVVKDIQFNRTNNNGNDFTLIGTAGDTYIRMGSPNGGAPFNALAGSSIMNDSEKMSVSFSIPVNELSGNVSTYLQSSTLTPATENYFSAKVSGAGVVTDESLNFISSDCTNAASSVCTFNTSIFTVTPNCVATPVGATSTGARVSAQSATAVTIDQLVASGGFNLICTKQGADYQTARILSASLVNNVTTKSVASPSSGYASVDASEAITKNPSAMVSSCTDADPSVCTFGTGFFLTDSSCVANPTSAGAIATVTSSNATTATIDRTDASTPFTLKCDGY